MSRAGLAVVVDGVALPEVDARAFWDRFSRHMEDNPRDLAGFAKAEGLASVHPEMGAGGAVLVGSTTAPQRAYANAPSRDAKAGGAPRPSSGSTGHHRGGNARPHDAKSSRKAR